MAKPTLILVDDLEEIRVELQVMLERDFEIVALASNALDAVALVKSHRPDLVLMDVVMPKMSGIEAVQAIMHLPPPHPKIVMMSGLKEEASVLKAMQAGALDYLQKPLEQKQLILILRELLQETQS